MNVSVRGAKTQLSKLLDLVEDGEPIVIERHGRPVAQSVPVRKRRASALGAMRGQFTVSPAGRLWVFNRHAHLAFDELRQRRLVELLPSVTYPIQQTRATPDGWNPAAGKGDVGVSAKYGITSAVTLDATINPDFSQVESDAFQVQVNQRFPIFYSEKRPFFMEGMGLFNKASYLHRF